MNAVDTNVLIYRLDHHEPAKQAKARELLRRLSSEATPTILLWQVLGETMRHLRYWCIRIRRDCIFGSLATSATDVEAGVER